MKKVITRATALLAACMTFSTMGMVGFAAESNDIGLSWYDLEDIAATIGCEAADLLSIANVQKVPTRYVAYVNDNYTNNTRQTSGSVSMYVNYNQDYLSYSSPTNKTYTCFNSSNSSSYVVQSGETSISGTTWAHRTATITWTAAATSGLINGAHMGIIAVDFSVVSGYELTVLMDQAFGSYTTHDDTTISSAVLNGSNITSNQYSSYLNTGFAAIGDLNGNHYLDSADLAILNSHFNGTTISPEKLVIADVNRDGKVDVSDIILLSSWLNS